MGVEAPEREPDDRDAGGVRRKLRRGSRRGAERARRKLGAEIAWRAAQALRRGRDLVLHVQDVRERSVAWTGSLGMHEMRAPHELLGVRERDGAYLAPRERPHAAGAHDDALRGVARRARRALERAREPALVEVLVAARCGIPDLDRAEVREVGRGIA